MRILQRYVLSQLLKVFILTVLALTVLLVIVGVIGEATKNGLGPAQILDILPFVIPSLFPFTIPATLLLTVCVVYGRMAGDQEITAMKSAGINVLAVLWPSFLMAAVLSLATFVLTDRFIPWARFNIERTITLAMEDIFLDILRTQNQFSDPERGIAISTVRVDGKTLISPTFRYTLPGGSAVTIMAREATLQFDIQKQQVNLSLYRGHIDTPSGVTLVFEHEERPFPLPMKIEAPKARDITIEKIRQELAQVRREREDHEQRQIITTAFSLTQGEFQRFNPQELWNYKFQRDVLFNRYNRLNTEIHSRLALACSCFFFTLLGSPFAVLQGKRQFLTSFALCFAPILIVYYPIILVTMNLGKDDKLNPAWGMWIGNAALCVVALYVIRRVLRH